jgi:hypothetical protein
MERKLRGVEALEPGSDKNLKLPGIIEDDEEMDIK